MELTLLKAKHDNNHEDKEPGIKSGLSISKARRCLQEQPFARLSVKIPRHIFTIDEKYLRHCLEFFYVTAAPNSQSPWEPFQAMNYSQLPTSITKRSGEWIPGSITRSKSMLNILKSPLLGRKDEPKPITFGSNPKQIDATKSTVSDLNRMCSYRKPSFVGGMLQVTWKSGSPHCVFSLEGNKEMYVAKMTMESDCIYVFHENESKIVGRMRVSTSVTLDQTDSEVKETEFVLFGCLDDYLTNDMIRTPSRVLKKKSNGLSKRVTRVLKTSRSIQVESKIVGDSCAWPRQVDDHFVPNLELVAVVVKERIHNRQQEEEPRGWGLKFLKKWKKIKEDNDECSTSIDIIVPAGVHGGPRMREGGPSGLIGRWRSGGQCDCGGWDMGCPFKVLQTRLNKPDSQSYSSFTLFLGDSSDPTMKMVSVDDNMYLIHFESGISALQTFATAVATIHCRVPPINQNK